MVMVDHQGSNPRAAQVLGPPPAEGVATVSRPICTMTGNGPDRVRKARESSQSWMNRMRDIDARYLADRWVSRAAEGEK